MLTLPTPGLAGWDADRPDGPQSGQLAWIPGGHRVVAGLKDATARVWDAKTGASLLTLDPRVVSGWWATRQFQKSGASPAAVMALAWQRPVRIERYEYGMPPQDNWRGR